MEAVPEIPDDVYFCPGCKAFHKDDDSHRALYIPGVEYVTDPETMKTYKVGTPTTARKRTTRKRPKKGFS